MGGGFTGKLRCKNTGGQCEENSKQMYYDIFVVVPNQYFMHNLSCPVHRVSKNCLTSACNCNCKFLMFCNTCIFIAKDLDKVVDSGLLCISE